MSKIKIFIVEDEFLHLTRMNMYLEELGYQVIGSATDGHEALNKIAATKPDLLVMDIKLNGELDGIEVSKMLQKNNPIPVIFTTSFKDPHTINRAKMANPYAYLTKPFEKETLQAAIELSIHRFTHSSTGINEHGAISWKEDQMTGQEVFVKSEGRLVKIDLNQVLYFEIKDKYCQIGLDDQILEVRIPLHKIESKLKPGIFIRVHRSFIINRSAIKSVDMARNEVQVNSYPIPISKTYRESFLNGLDLLDD